MIKKRAKVMASSSSESSSSEEEVHVMDRIEPKRRKIAKKKAKKVITFESEAAFHKSQKTLRQPILKETRLARRTTLTVDSTDEEKSTTSTKFELENPTESKNESNQIESNESPEETNYKSTIANLGQSRDADSPPKAD